MAVSQNDWAANDRSLIVKMVVPGTERHFTVRSGDVATVFSDFTGWFHKNIEAIDGGIYDDWGYAERNIRGSGTVSNHASGTAIDINATKHPLGRVGTFTPTQTAAIRQRLKRYKGAIRWGGDYSGRKDEMHFEINVGPNELRQIVQSLTAKPSAPSKPDTAKKDDVLDPYPDQNAFPASKGFAKGDGPSTFIKQVQQRLTNLGYPVGGVDGHFGPKTEAAVKRFQTLDRLKVDGVVGPETWRHLFNSKAERYRKPEPTYNFGPAYPGVVLKRGSRGPRVRDYQAMMRKRGWNIAVDGFFGPRTDSVTRQFQKTKGLTVDGLVGPKTWNAARSTSNK